MSLAVASAPPAVDAIDARVLEKAPARIAELDGLRGVAVALILLWHGLVLPMQAAPGSPLAYAMKSLSLSWAGVDVFFVLSGFLIGGILLDQRGAANYYRVFYARRACRILPAYAVVLGAYALAIAAGWATRPGAAFLFADPMPAWTYGAFVQNVVMAQRGAFGANFLAVTWSLAIEEQFYLLAPLVIRLVAPSRLPRLAVPLIAAAPLVRLAIYLTIPHGGFAAYVLLPARWDALLAGVLLAWALRDPAAARWLRDRVGLVWSALAAGLVGLGGLLLAGESWDTAAMATIGYSVVTLVAAAALALAVLPGAPAIKRALRASPLTALGHVSYGVYLFHQIVIGAGFMVVFGTAPSIAGAPTGLLMAGCLAAAIGAAALSYRVFEGPVLAFGHRARYHRGPASSAASANLA